MTEAQPVDYTKLIAARKARRRLSGLADRIVVAVSVVLVWQALASLAGFEKWISSPLDVAVRMWTMLLDGSLALHTFQTLQEAIAGLLLGIVIGGSLGLALGLSRRLSNAFDPIVMGLYSLPKVSLAPLFIIWFGIGISAKVSLVVSLVMFIVLYNVREGMKSIDVNLIDAFRSMKASRKAMLVNVIAPSLIPWLLTAVRIGIGVSLIGAVVGELVGSNRGLGWYVANATAAYDITGSFTALTALGILAMLLNAVLAWLESRFMSWRTAPTFGTS